MTRRPKARASIAALIAAMLLTACNGGPDEPDPTHAAQPANDEVADAEPVWTREIREGESPSGWAVGRDRVYRMAWPGAEEDRKAELTALDLATGEDLWTVEHRGVIGDLLVDESGGVIVVEPIGEASTLTAYDEQGQVRWTSSVDPVSDDISAGFLHDPVAAFDLENDLVMIGSRSSPGVYGLDLGDGSLRWHLRHETESGTPLYAGTQLDRFGDTLIAIDDFNAPSIAALDLDADGKTPTVRWHRDPGTEFGDGIVADEHGLIGVTASGVELWDLADGEPTAREEIDWHREESGVGGLEGRAFSAVYPFEDTIVIERDRRWVLDRSDASVRASYEFDDESVPLAQPLLERGAGPGESPVDGALIAVGQDGAIAGIDAEGSVRALRTDAVEKGSTYVPLLLAGESQVAVGVRRSDEPIWDLWAVERSHVIEAG